MNKAQRASVYNTNTKLIQENNIEVPRSFKVTWADVWKESVDAKNENHAINADTGVWFEYMKTDECARHYVEQGYSENICIMNFASRFNHGGGYKNGAKAQEEDLCRTIPALYPSLCKVRYPFEEDSIILTPGVKIMRDNHRYQMLRDNDMVSVSVVSAAAPNVRRERFNEHRIRRTLTNLFISVKKHFPETDTLILGAWGCGAYGNDPTVIARIMNEITWELGGIYRNIVYSVPYGPNTKEFEDAIDTYDPY